MSRSVIKVETGRPASDGAGVKLNRIFGGRHPEQYDPFLMLDHFGSEEASDYLAGFPSHPHRGFETVTYMLEGRMLHEDHLGNKGLLENGDVQWMTAARGIIHSEMPQQQEGRMSGFQLWVNLPAAEKMKDPAYRDIAAADIPVREIDGSTFKVIAGEQVLAGENVRGAVVGLSTDPVYVDVHLADDAVAELAVTDGHTALVYVYEGQAFVGDDAVEVSAGQVAILSREGNVKIKGGMNARAIVLAGKPINEPITQYGPFVMNTPAEIEQAVADYRAGTLTD
jgi:redox-sensitive bicupin YhaK (pirin superfamily)